MAGPDAEGALGVMWTPGRAEASVPPCGCWTWQSPDVHWFPGMGALKCSTVRDMLAARNAATTTPRPAAKVGVITSLRNAGLTRLALGRAFSGRSRPACSGAAGPCAAGVPGPRVARARGPAVRAPQLVVPTQPGGVRVPRLTGARRRAVRAPQQAGHPGPRTGGHGRHPVPGRCSPAR